MSPAFSTPFLRRAPCVGVGLNSSVRRRLNESTVAALTQVIVRAQIGVFRIKHSDEPFFPGPIEVVSILKSAKTPQPQGFARKSGQLLIIKVQLLVDVEGLAALRDVPELTDVRPGAEEIDPMRVTRLLGISGKVFQNSVSQLRSRDFRGCTPMVRHGYPDVSCR